MSDFDQRRIEWRRPAFGFTWEQNGPARLVASDVDGWMVTHTPRSTYRFEKPVYKGEPFLQVECPVVEADEIVFWDGLSVPNKDIEELTRVLGAAVVAVAQSDFDERGVRERMGHVTITHGKVRRGVVLPCPLALPDVCDASWREAAAGSEAKVGIQDMGGDDL